MAVGTEAKVNRAEWGASSAVLLRDAVRASRRWQTYAVRAGFTGLLFGGFLIALQGAVEATSAGLWDVAQLSKLGRGLFIVFSLSLLLLSTLLAPLMTGSAVIEETDERTLELLVLTKLTPRRVLGGLVLARLLVLLTIVAGALPVMTLVATVGGVSVQEVVSVSVATLANVVLLGALGAFFAQFTRSPMLAAMVSAAYVIPGFWLLPVAYFVATGSKTAPLRFSPFLVTAAEDWSALWMPLSFLPALWTTATLGARLFELRVGGAHIERAFSSETWNNRRWAKQLAALLLVGFLALPFLTPASWVWNTALGAAPWWGVPIDLAIYAWFLGVVHVGTWVWLRVGADVVDALDRMVGRRRGQAKAAPVRVWSNPVAWREARPRAWGATAMPILTTWGVLLLTVAQSMWWVIPGGLLAIAVLNAAAALALGVWVGSYSIVGERSAGTLPVLLTTRMSAGAIVRGKLLGVLLACSPMLALACPLLVIGYPHAGVWFAVNGGDYDLLALVATGMAAWVWSSAVWLGASATAMIVALRMGKPQAAFGMTLGALAIGLGAPGLAGRLAPDTALIAFPARVLAPPLAGGAGVVEYALAIGLAGGAAGAATLALGTRLRRWGGALLVLLALPSLAEAADAVKGDDLLLRVEAVGDPYVRGGRWTALNVTIANAGPGTTGKLELSERDASREVVRWERELDLPEGARKDVLLRFRAAPTDRDRIVTLQTRDGRALVAQIELDALSADAVALAVLGDDHLGLTGVSTTWVGPVPGRVARPNAQETRIVRTGLVPLATAPDHAADWSTFDWIVWPQADPARLDEDQLAALLHAVADGGHLLLGVTDTWRLVRESALGEALPVELTGVSPADVDLGAALGVASTGLETTTLATATLREAPGRVAWTLAEAEPGRPVWVAGTYGLGTIHVVLANLSTPTLRQLGAPLWRELLWLPEPTDAPAGRAPLATLVADDEEWVVDARGALTPQAALRMYLPSDVPGCLYGTVYDTWSPSPVDEWTGRVNQRLADIPGVAPVPIVWLVLFSALYLAVIGPVDYLVLRRLRREPLTWVTFPVTIAIFSGVALIGTTWTKGSTAVLTRVDLIDALPGTDLWRGETRIGVFSTRKTTLGLENGFRDAVLAPQAAEAGFLGSPVVGSSEGPTRLGYRAETWTLAYSESAWVEPLGPAPRLRRAEDGAWELVADLPVDLVQAWLVHTNDGGMTFWHALGPLKAGDRRPIPAEWGTYPELDEDMTFVRDVLFEAAESGRGHLHTAQYDRVLVGIAARPLEPISLTGLTPEERPLTVLRATLTPPASPPPPVVVPVDEEGFLPGSVVEAVEEEVVIEDSPAEVPEGGDVPGVGDVPVEGEAPVEGPSPQEASP